MKWQLSRRSFLRGLCAGAGASLCTPLVPSLSQAANDGQFPTRFVFMWTPQGTVLDRFNPSVNGPDLPLTNVQLPDITAPLEPWKEHLLIATGMDNKIRGPAKNNHPRGTGTYLTGKELVRIGTSEAGHPLTIGGGISVDQFIGKQMPTTFKSLEFAVHQKPFSTYVRTTLSYRDKEQPISVEADPRKMYARLWNGSGTTPQTDQEATRESAIRLASVDFAKSRLDALKKRVSSEYRPTLEAHWSSMREVETRLKQERQGTEVRCDPPNAPTISNPFKNSNYPAVGKAQMDLLVAALSCDLTRVATFMWDRAGSNTVFEWLGIRDDHHDLTHARKAEELTKIGRWYCEQLAYLCQRLKSVPQGDKTLLDHTVIVFANGMTNGGGHTNTNLPLILAGGANGFFKTNRIVEFNRPHNHLLVSLCHAMGLNTVQSFGNPAYVGAGTELHA